MADLFENMQAVRFRAMSTSAAEKSFVLVLMDATNINKVLLFIKVGQNDGTLKASDAAGVERFQSNGMFDDEPEIKEGNRTIGNIGITCRSGADEEVITLAMAGCSFEQNLIIDVPNEEAAGTIYNFVDSSDVIIGRVDNNCCSTVVDVQFPKSLATDMKKIILAWTAEVCMNDYQIHEMSVPEIGTITVSSLEHFSRDFENPDSDEEMMQVLEPFNRMRIRAAGFSAQLGLFFYDIIDVKTNKIILSSEFDPQYANEAQVGKSKKILKGQMVLRNSEGQRVLMIFGLFGDNIYYIYSATRQFIGYMHNDRFYTPESNMGIYLVSCEKKFGQSGPTLPILELYNGTYERMAMIFSRKGAVEYVVTLPAPSLAKMFMLTMALKASVENYSLHTKPLPDIHYCYNQTNLSKKVF